MKKYLYLIKNSKIPTYLKYWLMYSSKKISLLIQSLPITLENTIKDLKIVINKIYGNTIQDGEPSPDNEVPITNVTGDVEVVVENKNLGTFMSGFISLQGDYRTSSDMCFYFRVTKGQSYRYQSTGNRSIGAIFDSVPTENHTECIDGTLFNPLPRQSAFVAPASGIMVIYTNLNFSQEVMDSFQVEKGTEATSVVPHQEQVFTFPLGNEKLMLGDYLADDGIHHVRGQVVLDGTETWALMGNTETYYEFQFTNLNPRTKNEYTFPISSHFSNKVNNRIVAKYNNLLVRVPIEANITTVQEFKTWLSNNNVTVEYILEEEVIVPYTSAQQEVYNQIKQALSYEEQTNISSNQNIYLDIDYIKRG